jgi:hypothetical protein
MATLRTKRIQRKEKNDYLLKDEIEDLDNWSRIIVLKVRKA